MQFEMGEHVAEFPSDIHYATNHMWAIRSPDTASSDSVHDVWRFGLTEYAVRLLQDVYFLDWVVEPPAELARRAMMGSIESKKAESDLFSPIAGKLIAINDDVLSEPSLINADTYGLGWMFEIQSSTALEDLLDSDGYRVHLDDAWDVAQRTIKGQANT